MGRPLTQPPSLSGRANKKKLILGSYFLRNPGESLQDRGPLLYPPLYMYNIWIEYLFTRLLLLGTRLTQEHCHHIQWLLSEAAKKGLSGRTTSGGTFFAASLIKPH